MSKPVRTIGELMDTLHAGVKNIPLDGRVSKARQLMVEGNDKTPEETRAALEAIGLPQPVIEREVAKREQEIVNGLPPQPIRERGTTPKGLADFDAIIRRCHRYYGERLSDATLLKAIDAVAEHERRLVHHVRRMTLGEFVASLDEAMGTRRYGPDPDRQGVLYWDNEAVKVTPTNWRFLCAVWGRHDVPFADIGEAVYASDDAPPNRIRQLVLRVNQQLIKNKVDLTFTSEGECISPIGDWPT